MRFARTGLLATCALLSVGLQAAHSQITFVPDYSAENPGEGFNDPGLGAQRKTAFQFALGQIGSYFSTSYAGQSVVVRATFDNLGGSMTSATLGVGGATNNLSNFPGAPQANTFYPQALVNHIRGFDENGATAEVQIQFNSDVDNATVLGPTSWYYGTDRNPPGSNVDLVSVTMHEVAHGLGFSSFQLASGLYNGGSPAIWDRFLNDSMTGGNKLPSLPLSSRQAEATSNDVWWDGTLGLAGNGGITRPRIYAPGTFAGGSSLSHVDETTHQFDLMSPLDSGVANYSAMNLGMFRDMGWTIAVPEPSSLLLTFAAAAFGGRYVRRRNRKAQKAVA